MFRELRLRRPRRELALLSLVAVAALLPVFSVNAQDVSRLCLTRAIVHGKLSADGCLAGAFDRSSYGGHLYSDKAPGMSLVELPAAEALRLRPVEHIEGLDARLWGVRLLSSGIAFLACALLVGRVAEGLAPGRGGAALVAFALGTLAMPFAAANFEHLTAGALGFGAFLLASRRRPGAAGLLAGAAVIVEYQAAAIVAVLAVYVAGRRLRDLAPFAAGAVPGAALLAAYDTLAFGAPWRLSYRYVANGFSEAQAHGFFGIGVPRLFSSYQVFAGSGGLLVVSPVLTAAAIGLALLAREHLAEALVCAAVTAAFALLSCGYFLPYGGVSPGPRFVLPALPFLAAGLGPAFARLPRLTALLATLSIVPTAGLTLVWAQNPPLHRTIWAELARVPAGRSSSRFARSLGDTALGWLGVGRYWGAAAVALAALAAAALAFGALPVAREREPRRWPAAAAAAALALVAAAGASAISLYPYGDRVATIPPTLKTSISANASAAFPGDEVDFLVTLTNAARDSSTGVGLTIELPPGMELLGRPTNERGPGCDTGRPVTCNLDYLEPGMSTPVHFAVRIAPRAAHDLTVTTWGFDDGGRGGRASFTVRTGSS